MKTLRYILLFLVLLGGLAAMWYMQGRFDHADLNKAIAAVQAVRPGGPDTPSITEAITAKYKVSPEQIEWEASLHSKWWGTADVTAIVPGHSDLLEWHVDLSRQHITPHSEAAEQLLKAHQVRQN